MWLEMRGKREWMTWSKSASIPDPRLPQLKILFSFVYVHSKNMKPLNGHWSSCGTPACCNSCVFLHCMFVRVCVMGVIAVIMSAVHSQSWGVRVCVACVAARYFQPNYQTPHQPGWEQRRGQLRAQTHTRLRTVLMGRPSSLLMWTSDSMILNILWHTSNRHPLLMSLNN